MVASGGDATEASATNQIITREQKKSNVELDDDGGSIPTCRLSHNRIITEIAFE